ncbi:MAG: MMPL family transporter [Deltaproteobacteria bacterium]|nr:MMPL family transporter [Deltaproteobacteria bacterium]
MTRGNLVRLAIVVLSAVLLPAVFGLRFDMRPHAALPDRSADARAFKKLAGVLERQEIVLVMIEGTLESQLWTIGEVASRFQRMPEVEAVAYKAAEDEAEQLLGLAYPLLAANAQEAFIRRVSPEGLRDRAQALRARAVLPGGSAMMAQALKDPLGLVELLSSTLASATTKIDFTTGYVLVGEPAIACVFVKPKKPASDADTARKLFATVESLRDQLLPRGVTVTATGPHIFAAEYQRRLQSGLALSGALSIGLVVLVGLFLFRDIGALIAIALALAAAAAWTLGAASLLFGELQILAVSAASILPAVGIDAGVQAFAALKETSSKQPFQARLKEAFARVKKPIATAALAALLGFLAFTTAEVRAFRQFGALLALGVAANTIAMFTVLPLGFSLGGRLARGWPKDHPRRGLIERFGLTLGALPPQVLMAIAVGVVVVLFFLGKPPEHAFGFSALIDPSFAGAKGQATFEKAFGASSRHAFLLIEAKDRDAAARAQRTLQRALAAEKSVAVEGFALAAPTKSDLAAARALYAARPPAIVARDLEAAIAAEGFDTAAFAAGLERLKALTVSEAPMPTFTRFFSDRAAYDDGTALVSFFVKDGDADAAIARVRHVVVATKIEDATVELAGPLLVDRELERLLPKDAAQLTLLALLGVMAALVIARIGMREALIAICALLLVFTSLWFALGLLHVRLTLVTVLVFPFVLGIGVDATVYLVAHAAYRRSATELLGAHLRPLFASTLTTLAGFSALLAVPLSEIEALGVAVVVGLGLSLFFALVWVVAFAGADRN